MITKIEIIRNLVLTLLLFNLVGCGFDAVDDERNIYNSFDAQKSIVKLNSAVKDRNIDLIKKLYYLKTNKKISENNWNKINTDIKKSQDIINSKFREIIGKSGLVLFGFYQDNGIEKIGYLRFATEWQLSRNLLQNKYSNPNNLDKKLIKMDINSGLKDAYFINQSNYNTSNQKELFLNNFANIHDLWFESLLLKNHKYIDKNITQVLKQKEPSIKGKMNLAWSSQISKASYESKLYAVPLQNEKSYEANDSNWGYVDKNGKTVLPGIFQELSQFQDGIASYEYKNKIGIMDKNFNFVLPPVFEAIGKSSEGLIRVAIKGMNKPLPNRDPTNLKWGYIDLNGNLLINLQYDHAADFHEGLAAVVNKNYVQFIDINGNIEIKDRSFRFKSSHSVLKSRSIKDPVEYIYFSSGLAPVPYIQSVNLSGYITKYVYIDKVGNISLGNGLWQDDSNRFDMAFPFHEDIAIVDYFSKGFKYIDLKGQVLFNSIRPKGDFSNGWATASKKGDDILVSASGKITKFNDINCLTEKSYFSKFSIYCDNNNFGFFDKSGNKLTSPIFKSLQVLENQIVRVNMANSKLVGILKLPETWILEPQ